MSTCLIKCRKCRHMLGSDIDADSSFLSAHGEPIGFESRFNSACSPQLRESNLYFVDESVPDWIRKEVVDSGWTRAKLHCPGGCGARVGSFDYVSCPRCECQRFLTPSAHVILARVDIIVKTGGR